MEQARAVVMAVSRGEPLSDVGAQLLFAALKVESWVARTVAGSIAITLLRYFLTITARGIASHSGFSDPEKSVVRARDCISKQGFFAVTMRARPASGSAGYKRRICVLE